MPLRCYIIYAAKNASPKRKVKEKNVDIIAQLRWDCSITFPEWFMKNHTWIKVFLGMKYML